MHHRPRMVEEGSAGLSDPELAQACRSGDHDALAELIKRHGPMMEAIVVRVVDERRGGMIDEYGSCFEMVVETLERDLPAWVEPWHEDSTLRHYLAVVTRQVAGRHLQEV